MKDAQLGQEETSSLLNDRYVPFKPSKEKVKDARKKNIYVPTGEINALRSLRRGMSLRKEPDSDELGIPDLFGLGNQRAVNPTLPPRVDAAPTTTPNVNIQPIAPVQTASANPLTRTNPSFLGSNPIDVLKNLDIARRTG